MVQGEKSVQCLLIRDQRDLGAGEVMVPLGGGGGGAGGGAGGGGGGRGGGGGGERGGGR